MSVVGRIFHVAGRVVLVSGRVVLVIGRVILVAGRAVPVAADSPLKLAKLSTTIAGRVICMAITIESLLLLAELTL